VSAAQWDGLPENPERDGWHWVIIPSGQLYCLWWRVAAVPHPVWAYATRGMPPKVFAEHGFSYIGPCHTPAEVAALVEQARREEREACATWHDERAAKERASGSITGARAEEYAAAAIRARSAP